MLSGMVDTSPPPHVVALAQRRSAARARRDWAVADDLKAQIEVAGWRVVDSDLDFQLLAAQPGDIVTADETIYGSVDSVPSLLGEPSTMAVSVVVVPGPGGSPPGATLAAVAAHRTASSQVVVVVHHEIAVDDPSAEVVRTVVPFTPGDTLQAGLQRSAGEVVIVIDTDHAPVGDFVSPLRQALLDDGVAVVGIGGLVSGDMHHYHPLAHGDATALRSGCLAFRRADGAMRGPIDPRLHLPGSVATWWSLRLRDEGPGSEPRRAVALDLPVTEAAGERLPHDHARSARRDAYRISKLLGRNLWLATEEPPQGRVVGDGTDDDRDGDDRDQPDHASQS